MHLFCHDHPETLSVVTDIVDLAPGRIALAQSPFYPGGGGQLADEGVVRWSGGEARVTGFEMSGGKVWHRLDTQAELSGVVEATVDPVFRRKMRQLHTGTHILNALVFQSFDGALVTGVQMAGDGTTRMDFDVPDADNDRLRALKEPIKDAIRQNIPVTFTYIGISIAQAEHGLIRSRSVAPPPGPDGQGAHRRDRGPRSTGLWRDPSRLDWRLAVVAHSQDREQGTAQSPGPVGPGGKSLIFSTICWHMP